MIKENELRIGNFIGSIQSSLIHCVDLDMFCDIKEDETYLDHLKPIPLTEEWLIKMGFEKSQEQWYTIKYFTDCELATEQMAISYNLSSNRCAVFDAIEETDIVNILSYPIYTSKKVLYVHTLQNVFFALTGEELKLDHDEVR
jgi:hypothetical protein